MFQNDHIVDFKFSELSYLAVLSVLWCCWLGDRKGIRSVKTLGFPQILWKAALTWMIFRKIVWLNRAKVPWSQKTSFYYLN